jgi:hypothetical protein
MSSSLIDPMTTQDPLYDEPLRYKLKILQPDESDILDPLYTFDSFNTNNAPFALNEINVNLSVGTTGDFRFIVDDTKDRVIKDTIDCGNIAVIQAGKTPDEYQNICYGIIDNIVDAYPISNQIKYEFSGLGMGVIANYTILNFLKSVNKEDISAVNPVISDPAFRLDNLAIEAFENPDLLPVRNSKIPKDRGGFDTSALKKSSNVFTASVNQGYSTLSSILENFATTAGQIFYFGPNKEVLFRAPHRKHSGITIRPWNETRTRDRADRTSYYYGGWTSQKMMRLDQGFFNRIFLTINVDELTTSSSGETTVNFLSLANRDIGQQFIPGSIKLFNIALLLSKNGTGRSSVEDAFDIRGLQGVIVKDDGNNKPSNKIVATFTIPYDKIESSPTFIYDINLQYFTSTIEPTTKHWIILFKSGFDENNTILWYNDADYITDSTATNPRYSGTKSPFTEQPTPDKENFAAGFTTTSKGPVFTYSFFATKTTTLEVSDPISIKKYTPGRPIEIKVNAPWIHDVKTGFRYANTLLAYGAKLKRVFDKQAVSIPTKLFFPLNLVTIVYPLAGLPIDERMLAEVNSVNYSASGGDLEHPFGSDTVNLTATAYVNHWQKKIGVTFV